MTYEQWIINYFTAKGIRRDHAELYFETMVYSADFLGELLYKKIDYYDETNLKPYLKKEMKKYINSEV